MVCDFIVDKECRKRFRYLRQKLLSWFSENARDFPWRHTNDPYNILVAEVMLHQTFAEKVVPVYETFIDKYPNSLSLSRAREKTVSKIIKTLGLNYRAKLLISIAKEVKTSFSGSIPSNLTDLLSIKGIGPYSAGAVMCFAYGKRVPIIDTNVVRMYSRFFCFHELKGSSGPKWFTEFCKEALPRKNVRDFNYALLDFPALVCTHYRPSCDSCIMKRKCESRIV